MIYCLQNAKECLHTYSKLAAENRAAQKRRHRSLLTGDFVMVNTKYIELETPQRSKKCTPVTNQADQCIRLVVGSRQDYCVTVVKYAIASHT
jgi:hypothetical protein